MNILRYLWLGGVLGVLLLVTLLAPLSSAEANPDPGKVTFKSAHTNYEYEVGKDAVNVLTTTTASSFSAASSTTTFRPRLIFPGWTPQNLTKEPSTDTGLSKGSTGSRFGRRKRTLAGDNGPQGEESRRISIAIRPSPEVAETTNVEVKVKNSMVSSTEDEDQKDKEASRDLTTEAEDDDELEQRKRDCRGLPWPFVNALNATNCLDLDSEEFRHRLISREESEEDEEDATVVLPKKGKNRKKAGRRVGGSRRKQPREEDYEEDYPLDPFHNALPQARTYHEYAMMLRDSAIPENGVPPFLRGPITYQDFYNRQYRNPYEDQSSSSHTDHGWGWTTTPPPNNGWGQPTTAQPAYGYQRQPHELKPSFGQPSQPQAGTNGQPASFGQPSNPQQGPQGKTLTFGQPPPQQSQQQPASFGQPAAPQNQTTQAPGNRQGKALEFGQPSQQQLQVPAPPQNVAAAPTQQQQPQQQFQSRSGYLQPAYYAPPTQAPYYGYSQQQQQNNNNGWGWGETTTQSSGWGWESTTQSNGWTQESTTQNNNGWGQTTTTTTTPPPDYRQPPYQQQNQPSPTVFPIYQANQTAPQPQQQSNATQVLEMYNRLLSLYRLLINDTSNQQPQQTSPPVYQQPNPWQVPPPQTWSGVFAAGNQQYDGYYPSEMLPGIVDDPYLYDPLDQPKLLPKPISPVGRRSRQFRRRNNFRQLDADERERDREPRVSFMSDGPTVLHEIDNKETFLPRRRYFKRKINDEDFKSISSSEKDKKDKGKKKKKSGKRRWGTSSREDDYDDYDMDTFSDRRYKHPEVPPWLRYGDTYDYVPPVYGQPPPPESGGGWGQPTQAPPPQNGWGWEQTTTQSPGWGWDQTTTTQSPGWGWEQTTTTQSPGWGWESSSSTTSTTTTTTTQAPPPSGQQQENATTTEEGPVPGQQWNPPQDSQAYLQQQFLQLQQQLLQQLQASGRPIPPQYQQMLQQQPPQQPQMQQQKPPVQQQFPILQPNFGTQGQISAQPIQQPSPIPQQIKQQSVNGTAGGLDPVIEDVGRNDPTTDPTPVFRDQLPNVQNNRVANARQLFGEGDSNAQEVGRSVVQTVTSKSVVESTAPAGEPQKADGGAPTNAAASQVQVQPGQVQQVSASNVNDSRPSTSGVGQNVYSGGDSTPAARQLRYSISSTPAEMGSPTSGQRMAPSWGNWAGSYSPTYSKVQNAQPYRIMKRVNEQPGDGQPMGLIETKFGEAKKLDLGGAEDEVNRPSLARRVVD